DIDSPLLTFSIVSQPAHGTLQGSGGNRTYKPDLNWNGTDSFKYKASDGSLQSSPATVTILVNAVNDAPTVNVPGAKTTDQDVNLNLGPITGSDVDAAETVNAQVKVTLSVAQGTLTLTAPQAGLVVTGNGSKDVELAGTLAAINATLNTAA